MALNDPTQPDTATSELPDHLDAQPAWKVADHFEIESSSLLAQPGTECPSSVPCGARSAVEDGPPCS